MSPRSTGRFTPAALVLAALLVPRAVRSSQKHLLLRRFDDLVRLLRGAAEGVDSRSSVEQLRPKGRPEKGPSRRRASRGSGIKVVPRRS